MHCTVLLNQVFNLKIFTAGNIILQRALPSLESFNYFVLGMEDTFPWTYSHSNIRLNNIESRLHKNRDSKPTKTL